MLAFRGYRCAQPTAKLGLSPVGEGRGQLSEGSCQFSEGLTGLTGPTCPTRTVLRGEVDAVELPLAPTMACESGCSA